MYFTAKKSLTTTPELVAGAVNVDRTVLVQEAADGHTNIMFNSDGDPWGVEPSSPARLEDFRFVLPAGVELWAFASPSDGTATCQFMVTSVGR